MDISFWFMVFSYIGLGISISNFIAELTIEFHKWTLPDSRSFDITFGLYSRFLSHWWGRPIIYATWYLYWLWVFFWFTQGLLMPQTRGKLRKFINNRITA